MKKPKFKSYRRINGHDEFKEFYQDLPEKDRKKLIGIIEAVQQQGLLTAIKMEWVKKLDINLYEIRSKTGNNIQRGLYFHVENEDYIITHGFTKKTQKTPNNEIKHAKVIRKEFWNRKEDKNE